VHYVHKILAKTSAELRNKATSEETKKINDLFADLDKSLPCYFFLSVRKKVFRLLMDISKLPIPNTNDLDTFSRENRKHLTDMISEQSDYCVEEIFHEASPVEVSLGASQSLERLRTGLKHLRPGDEFPSFLD
jgi:hypothetical protein